MHVQGTSVTSLASSEDGLAAAAAAAAAAMVALKKMRCDEIQKCSNIDMPCWKCSKL